MNRHISILVSGKVQGVFFRASAKQKAEELDIKGFVQNHTDGSVYIEAEGADDKLTLFKNWCTQGPPRAHVEQVDIKEGDLKNFNNFTIVH